MPEKRVWRVAFSPTNDMPFSAEEVEIPLWNENSKRVAEHFLPNFSHPQHRWIVAETLCRSLQGYPGKMYITYVRDEHDGWGTLTGFLKWFGGAEKILPPAIAPTFMVHMFSVDRDEEESEGGADHPPFPMLARPSAYPPGEGGG